MSSDVTLKKKRNTPRFRPVGRSGSGTAHAQFISEMAAAQGGPVDAADKKDIKTEPSEDGAGNGSGNNASDSRTLSPSPSSSSSSGGGAAATNNSTPTPPPPPLGSAAEQQTLVAVLQFLRKNKLHDSVDILRREAGLPEDSLDVKGGDPAAGGAAGGADADGVDAASILSRVSVSTSAAAPPPSKGRVRAHTCPPHEKY